MANKGFTMKVKTSNKYVTLSPQIISEQIIDANFGEVFVKEVNLSATNWNENLQQTIELAGILSSDTPVVTKILEGTAEQMKQQEEAFNCINPITGVFSTDNAVRFTCKTKPQVDFKIQIYWTR